MMWMLGSQPGVNTINEPMIGSHLAAFPSIFIATGGAHLNPRDLAYTTVLNRTPGYFFSKRYEHAWRPLMRQLILGRLAAQATDGRDGRVHEPRATVVKEPNGSQAADLIMSLLPRSRLLFLLRDGRDVVDSGLDTARAGSWLGPGVASKAGPDRDTTLEVVEFLSRMWVSQTEVVEQAYGNHDPSLRLKLRYEDLLGDTEARLSEVFAWLGLKSDGPAVRAAVARFAFDAIPAERKGPGKFVRAATPGLWRDTRTADEQEVMHRVMGKKLSQLGYR